MISHAAMLEHHLCFNHFPPISNVFVPVAEQAIELANLGDWDALITMPNDITLSVGEIVDQLHLIGFLTMEEDYWANED